MKFLIIINTKAGTSNKNKVLKSIYQRIPKDDFQIVKWENASNELESLIKAGAQNYSMIVAVGGDGTVNYVANSIIKSNVHIPLAIIPCGSGNGLARFLKIPLNPGKAIELLYNGKVVTIDTCKMNDVLFLSTCGIGFDAKVGYEFSKLAKRGFRTYLKVVLKYYWKYKPQQYKIEINHHSILHKAMLITAANSNQFGNNVIIAPEADIKDGLFNITIIKPFPWLYSIIMAYRLFNGTINKSRFVKTYTAKSMIISQLENDMVQFDGESYPAKKQIDISIIPRSLKILAP